MRWLLLCLCIVIAPLSTSAESLSVGDTNVQYDTVSEVDTTTLYYQKDALVASESGEIIVIYKNERAVMEAHDTNADGSPDTFITLDATDSVQDVSGTGATELIPPPVTEFTDLLAGEVVEQDALEDLVGSLESITVPKHRSYGLYLFFLLLVAGGWWWYKKK